MLYNERFMMTKINIERRRFNSVKFSYHGHVRPIQRFNQEDFYSFFLPAVGFVN